MPDQANEHKASTPILVSLNHAERAKWRMGLASQSHEEIHSSAYRLATVIEDLMNKETGEAFPSQEDLAARSGMSDRQVRKHINALAAARWLKVLDGKERTRPKSKRGSHYRPMWPDEETRARCMGGKGIQNSDDESAARTGSPAPVSKACKTGQGCPVSDNVKTGHLASQNRKSGVAKPEVQRRSHSNDGVPTDLTTKGKPPQGGFPHQGSDDNSDYREAAFADASGPHTGGDAPLSFDGEVEEQPDWLSQIPMPNSLDDYLDNGIADDPSVAGQKSTTSADAFDDDADAPEIDDAELDADQLAAWQSLDAVWDDDAGKKIYEGAEN